MRLPVNRSLPLAALTLLAACGGSGSHIDDTPLAPNGPSGDYPMVLGPAYSVGGVNFTPSDALNYDAVGVAVLGGEGGPAITVAHHTLPLPSYVEITALDTGRTILARVERRGPMDTSDLVQLSPGAAAQLGLGAAAGAQVRVRRVNPPEQERAMLRSGQPAPARMDTPKSLLDVLRRRIGQGELTRAPAPMPPAGGAVVPPAPPVEKPVVAKPAPGKPAKVKPVKPAPKPVATPAPVVPDADAPVPVAAPAPKGSLVVQVGAFSSKDRAMAVASRSGAQVVGSGSIWRVRMGPFASQAEADAALAKAKAAGYSDARIQRAN